MWSPCSPWSSRTAARSSASAAGLRAALARGGGRARRWQGGDLAREDVQLPMLLDGGDAVGRPAGLGERRGVPGRKRA